MSDCGDCKEIAGDGKLSVYLMYDRKIDVDKVSKFLKINCGFTDVQISNVIKFINSQYECIIFSGGYEKGIFLAQKLADNDIKHEVRDERFSK